VSIDASPPAQPPQLSPDGKWVWDGTKWQPVAGVEPVHMGIFPAWNSITVDPAEPVVEPVQQAPVQQAPVQQTPMQFNPEPEPVVDYGLPAVSEPVVPLWQQRPASGLTTYMYVGVGVVVLVMAMILLNSMNFIQLPWPGSGSSSSNQTVASPTPNNTGTEFVRAERFLNSSLEPAVISMSKTLPTMSQVCVGTLSNSCFNAIGTTDQQVQTVVLVIDRGSVPLCIAGPVNKIRADFQGMHAGLQAALTGFQNNDRAAVGNGLTRFSSFGPALKTDGDALTAAEQTCTK
jgi:hypothetical protein